MSDSTVTARPQIYIDVTIHGQKHVYDIETARSLASELHTAILALEQEPERPIRRSDS